MIMKFKNILSITAIMAMLSVVACGGGSDDPNQLLHHHRLHHQRFCQPHLLMVQQI